MNTPRSDQRGGRRRRLHRPDALRQVVHGDRCGAPDGGSPQASLDVRDWPGAYVRCGLRPAARPRVSERAKVLASQRDSNPSVAPRSGVATQLRCKFFPQTAFYRSSRQLHAGGASTSFRPRMRPAAHASHPCSARHSDPREHRQRRRPRSSAFHGGPSCPKAMAKWCL